MKTPQVLFIIINYFNESEVEVFIRHLKKQPLEDYHLLIVNNGSDDENKLIQISNNMDKITVLHPGKNIGYLGGAKYALTNWLNKNQQVPEFTILCNTDIEFASSDFFNILVKETADIIGPCIRSSKNNSFQNPYYKNRITKNKLIMLHRVYSFYPAYLLYQSLALIKSILIKNHPYESQTVQPIYAVHGSFMIFKNTFFMKGGNFNYESFLYGEEIFIAEIARQYSMQVIYDPNLKIVHHEHSTTGTFKKQSHIRFMKKSIEWLSKTFYK